MLTTDVKGISTYFPVGGTPGSLPLLQSCAFEFLLRRENVQPVDDLVVREPEDEFVDHPVDAHRAADELHGCIGWVVEDKAFAVEGCQTFSSYTSLYVKYEQSQL